jgi:hypothetical protein
VVELSRRNAADLAWLVETEELNKTTIVNRAISVYKMLIEAQEQGRRLLIDDPDEKGVAERIRIV